jgi:hypothetical protein
MAPNLEHTLRAMPGYTVGVQHGTDMGLVIALTAITVERAHQERLASRPDSGSPACRVYADGVLLAVAKAVARRFRQ